MDAFLYNLVVEFKIDLRNRGVLLTYYVVPLAFFAFMGGIFSSINPASKETLIQSMTVFGVTMGAVLGTPTKLVELFRSDVKKSYVVGGIPLWTAVVNNCLSGFAHLFIMSTIILLAAPAAFGAAAPGNLVVFFLSLAVFLIATLSTGAVLGVFINSSSRLTILSQVIFLPSVMLSGIMFSPDLLPDTLAEAGRVLPATWGFKAMVADTVHLSTTWPLLIITTVCLVLVAWGLRLLQENE